MTPLRCLSLLGLLVASSNCAPPPAPRFIERDGFELGRSALESDLRAVGAKASFDLGCDPNGLRLRVLSVMHVPDDRVTNIAVAGCGKQAR